MATIQKRKNKNRTIIGQESNELGQEIHKVLEFSKSYGDFHVFYMAIFALTTFTTKAMKSS